MDTSRVSTGRIRRAVWFLLAASLLVLVVQLGRAGYAARAGEADLRQARQALQERRVTDARDALARAEGHFATATSGLRHLGPLGVVGRATPLVRVQLRAARDLVAAGAAGAGAALTLTPVLDDATAPGRRTGQVVKDLAGARPLIDDAVRDLGDVSRRLHQLRGYRLVWPLNDQVDAVRSELDGVLTTARRAQHSMTVLLDLSGADGPRTYLLLSQNPDEVRPTGGYMGTYGVATGSQGTIRLTTYGATEAWTVAHPASRRPAHQAPFVFGYVDVPQDLSNAATVPDWPRTAEAAAAMWQAGGEPPADGVLTFMPALLVRLVGVLGPTRVPGYPDVLTATNVAARIEFYTHGEGARGRPGAARKQFIGDLAKVVFDRVVQAPTDRLPDLLAAMSAGLTAREAMIWSRSADVQAALRSLEWDGAFPSADGDFYADAEFAFASKNGRGLLRTFDHTVTLGPTGSGTSDTVMVLRNTLPYEPGNNVDSSAYLTPYGPRGGRLDPASDPPDEQEPALEGHPTAGWLRAAPPKGSTRLQVRWQADDLAVRRSDGDWDYRLTWLPTPGHRGDVLTLSVVLPPGAHWVGPAPPRRVALQGPFRGRWRLRMAAPDSS